MRICPTELCAVLLLTASGAVAAGAESLNPAEAHFGLARVVARRDSPVRFAQLLEYQCEPASSCADRDLLVANGDRLVTGATEGNRVYVWFRGGGRYLRGWLNTANVKDVPFNNHPAPKTWEGTWAVGDLRKIVIRADPATSELTVAAHAEWYGAQLDNGERVMHTGDVQGKAVADGNRLIIRQEDCVLELELVDEFLGAIDNMHCGGMNVGFSDAYIRVAGVTGSLREDHP
jgi:hypothetical protein